MQIGFYFDQSRCTGCYACEIACRDWHDIQDTRVKWRRVSATEQGAYPGCAVVLYVAVLPALRAACLPRGLSQ